MKSADIIARLVREGWTLARQRQPSADVRSERSGRVTVPHPRKEIPTGTLRNIYRQAGWPWKERS
ncbi:MAG: type II toxin-antitoxin system HicA family toxin [Acidobacteria bacterium]|nr:type II toxin-antitoxin system HicA family toxin [Acidobacteriota bacterium]